MKPPDAEVAARPLAPDDLPRLDGAVVACAQALRGRCAPRAVRLGSGAWHAAWQEHDAPLAPGGFDVGLRIGGWRYVLRIETADGGFLPMGIDLASLAPVVARSLLAQLCDEAVQVVEHASGLRVLVDGVWPADAAMAPQGVGLLLRNLESGLCTRAAMQPQDAASHLGLAQLCAGWRRLPASARPAWAPRWRLWLGSTRLPAVELAQLEPEDLLFIEDRPGGRGAAMHAAVCVGSGSVSAFMARVEGRNVEIEDDDPEHQMVFEDDGAAGEPPELQHAGQLEFTVRFWLGGRRIGWPELQALRAGSVLTLDQPVADAEVQLELEGQRIGRGRLVAVGERLGVRLTSLVAPQPRPAADESPALS